MKKVYVVFRNADLNEGRGPMLVEAICEKQTDANVVADSAEPYGHRGQFCQVEAWPVLATAGEYLDQKTRKLKEKALAKLTSEEKKVLGL